MKRKIVSSVLVVCLLCGLAACGNAGGNTGAEKTMKEKLLAGVDQLEKSENLYYEDGLTITGLGVNFSGEVTKKTDNYFWPAIEKLTGVNLDIYWEEEEKYTSSLSSTLLTGMEDLPDILNPGDFGIMDLADDGVVIALDDYLDLMPDLVAAVGEERMGSWRQADGHIYSIPSIVNVPGAKTMMVRKDWLDTLGMDEPKTWDEWVDLWRAIRDNDVNGNGDPNDEIPFATQYGQDGERAFIPLLNAFGIKTSVDTQFCQLEDGTYTMIYEHPDYPEFLKAMRSLYEEGLIYNFDSMYLEEMDAVMDENRLGTVYGWAERCRTSAQTLRESGVTDALWEAVAPIIGPDGAQMTPEREMISPMWCITSAAEKNGKAEDIVRFFNWCFSEEGSRLYSYGLEGISYEVVDGKPVMDSAFTANGFTDYRASGCNIECFGGLWKEGAFMQCLFEGKTEKDMDELTEEFYKGIHIVNDGYYYTAPKTYETPAYTKYRNSLITAGICPLRNKVIKGEITVEQFYEKYNKLKQKGLQKVIDEVRDIAG